MRLLSRCSVTLILATAAVSAQTPLPNGSFEEGAGDRPAHWQLSGGEGAWESEGHTGRRCVSVTGDGKNSTFWRSDTFPGLPNRTYRITYYAKTSPGTVGGCLTSGTSFINRDFQAGETWTKRSFCFVTPANVTEAYVRLGQWTKKGKVFFDDVSITPVEPVHARRGGLVLGSGESIVNNRYSYHQNWGGEGSNYARVLRSFTAGFNSNRWGLGPDNQITYRLGADRRTQTRGRLYVTLAYYSQGQCVVECSKDGQTWQAAFRCKENGTQRHEVPKELYPTTALWVRLRSEGSFQITDFGYEADLERPVLDFVGSTRFLEIQRESPDLRVAVHSLGTLQPGKSAAKLELTSTQARRLAAKVILTPEKGQALTFSAQLDLPAGRVQQAEIPYELDGIGQWRFTLKLADAANQAPLYAAATTFSVPSLHDSSYGYLLSDAPDCALWWCEGTYKVSRTRGLPPKKGQAIRLSAAGNEYEPFQLVLRPKEDLKAVTVKASGLRRAGGGEIPATNVQVCLVNYVPVTIPTDRFGCRADWPDPLPPYQKPFDCPAQRNQPLWITVKVPANAKPGDYRGTVTVAAQGVKPLALPVELHVWNFSLTDETHTRTAYGVGVDRKFHGLKTTEQAKQVHDLYMQNCRDHRIAPYSPMAYAPIKWSVDGPQTVIDTGALRLVCDQYRGEFFQIFRGEQKLGATKSLITQFEKKGLGYQGTGEGWPSAQKIEDLKFIERSPEKVVLEMTGVHSSSSECNRRYKARHRFTFWAGKPFFSDQLLWIRNTDELPWTVRQYYHILAPANPAEATPYNGPDRSAWLSPLGALGALTAQEGTFSFRLSKREANACHGDITEPLNKKLEPGETLQVARATLVIVAAPQGTKEAVDEAIQAVLAEVQDGVKPQGQIKVASETEPRIEIDYADFDQAAHRYLDEFKFNAWNFRGMPGSIAGEPRFTPEFQRLYKLIYTQFAAHLKEKGWLHKAYAYWFDEPNEQQYPYVIEGMKLIKAGCPGLTRLLTEQPEPPLYGHVDLWVPVLSRYNPDRCHERQAAGDEVWWYVCCGPRAPYPNNFIDHPAVNHRIRFWMAEKYHVTGSLYWSTTYYRGTKREFRNPWKTAMSYSPSGGMWGNGDGMLLYPPVREPSDTPVIRGPINSIRWEMLREGLEDREYFWTLKQRLAKAHGSAKARAERALQLPDRLCTSLTEFNDDPQALYQARARLAEAIEALPR